MRGLFAFVPLFLLAFFMLSTFSAKPAQACVNCGCVSAAHAVTASLIRAEHAATKQHVTVRFQMHRDQFIVGSFFPDYILPTMMMMTEQLSSVAMQQMLAVGSFFDASQQLETQRLLQEKTAEAHKDYHPSVGMCEIGTNVRSLAAAQRKAELNNFILGQRAIDRNAGQIGTISGKGAAGDKIYSRMTQFQNLFCNGRDLNGQMAAICNNHDSALANLDIDFPQLIDGKLTLDADFSDQSATMEEAAIMAMGANLYGNDTFNTIPEAMLNNPDNLNYLLDLRSIQAKRSVAQIAYNALVGEKTKGSAVAGNNAEYMEAVFSQLGVDNGGEAAQLVGDQPSYHAQMEILTKKLYQRPDFYTDLYDKPANVDRKGAALRAISLMQNKDMLDGQLRREAIMAVLLEVSLSKYQEDIQNRLNSKAGE
jgi:hypothetical protein